jgi:hypothetical protein
LLHQRDLSGGSTGGVDHPPDCVGQPEGVEALGVDDDEELQEAGPWGNEGSQHLRRQGTGSCDHSGRRWGRLLRPRAVRGRGEGVQGGLNLPEHPVDAPRGAGSRRRCHR